MGYDRIAICKQLGIPKYRLNNAIADHINGEWHEGKRAFKASQGPDSKPARAFRDVLDVPIPRYAKPVPMGKKKGGKWKTAVLYGDTHHPFHDATALNVVRGVIADTKPDLVVHLGDLLDCYKISSFSKDPSRVDSLQDEIDAARIHLAQVSSLAPDAEKLLLGGNHEDRLRKTIWDLKGAQRELARLRVFQKSMTWPALLELIDIGWDFVDYTKQPVVGRIPRFLLKHGEVVRKFSAFSAKGEWEKHARSGISGHTHRMGSFLHRNLDGTQGWWEGGCTCNLDPEYVRQPDWHSGCHVVTYSADWFNVAPVYIENGKAFWREREFAA